MFAKQLILPATAVITVAGACTPQMQAVQETSACASSNLAEKQAIESSHAQPQANKACSTVLKVKSKNHH